MSRTQMKEVASLEDMEDTLIATSLILKNLARKIETLKNIERKQENDRRMHQR